MTDLKEIMSISGYSGLFKMVSQGKNSLIVESLIDKKRMPAFSSHKISTLSDIAIFTDATEKPLIEVFKSIFDLEEGKACIDPKSSPDKLKEYFLKVLPNYDQERVYVSDIKKVLLWYNQLIENNLLEFTEEVEVVETKEEKNTEKKDDTAADAPKPKKAKAATGTKTAVKPKASNQAPKQSVKAKGKTTSFSSKKGGE